MIFPDWGSLPETVQAETELPLFAEWDVDWENGTFSLRNGAPYLVFGDEALKIWVDSEADVDVEYLAHCQTYGWLNWQKNGSVSGTTGLAKRMEAIRIKLTGADADKYDIYYRVHCQTFGWLDWAKNGAPAGSAGYAKRMEAIQIVVVPKGSAAPGSTLRAYYEQ